MKSHYHRTASGLWVPDVPSSNARAYFAGGGGKMRAGRFGGAGRGAVVPFGPVSASLSTLVAIESEIPDDGTTPANFLFTARDIYGHAMAGVSAASLVPVSSRGGDDTLAVEDAVTTAAGQAGITLRSEEAGDPILSVTFLGVAVTQTATVTVTGDAPAEPPSVFASAFSTLGNSDAAFRDTSRSVPWSSINGSNPNCAVVDATGHDFPCPNALEIVTAWNGSGSSSKIPRLTGVIPIPDDGEDIFYRFYIEMGVPVIVPTWGSPHPIQDGPDSGNFNWEYQPRRGTAGLVFSPGFQFANNAFPNNNWHALNSLNVFETYRVELNFHRLTSTTYNFHVRIYDSDGVLVLDDADFLNQTGTGSTSLGDTPTFMLANAARLADFQCGSNGAMQGTVAGDHPVLFMRQSAFNIGVSTWMGAFVTGEGP